MRKKNWDISQKRKGSQSLMQEFGLETFGNLIQIGKLKHNKCSWGLTAQCSPISFKVSPLDYNTIHNCLRCESKNDSNQIRKL
jgi:hypothetical protein